MAMSEDFESRAGHLRSELLVHCYQMLGSVHDAGDSVQETMLRAWRAYDRYDASGPRCAPGCGRRRGRGRGVRRL